MAACLPFFDGGNVVLVGFYPGGVGNDFTGPNYGSYHNAGYDNMGGCTGDFSVVPAATQIYIGNTGVWDPTTKTGNIGGVGLGDGAIVSITIDDTIIRGLGVGAHAVSVQLAHGIFDTGPGHRPSPGIGSLIIQCKTTLVITSPASFPAGQVGVTYPANQTVIAGGGTAPYTYSLASGSLPPGLSLSSGGTISGTPTTVGVYTFTVSAVDVAGAACPAVSNVYTITVPSANTQTAGSLSPGADSAGGAGCASTVAPGTAGGNACSATVAPGADSGGT